LVGTVIVDEDGIYDPRHPNDRLLLGVKSTMSELELLLFRQRSQEVLRQKARRGALVLGVAAGYVKVGRDRIEKDPDQRVQETLQLVFTKFAEFQSARRALHHDQRVEHRCGNRQRGPSILRPLGIDAAGKAMETPIMRDDRLWRASA